MKTVSGLFFAFILALVSTQLSAQDISNMSNWTTLEWQRYNDKLTKDMKKAADAASKADAFEPLLKPCSILIRGGVSNGMASCISGGANASAAMMIGGIYGFCFCPEVGIDARNIEDDGWTDTFVEGQTITLNSTNIKVRPLQLGYYFTAGPLSSGFYGGIYGSYDLRKTLSNEPIFNYLHPGNNKPMKEYNPVDIGMHLGIDFFFWRLNLNFGFDKGFVPVFKDTGKCWNAFITRVGFFF